MRVMLAVVLTTLLLTGSLTPTRIFAEEAAPNRTAAAVAKGKNELELSILKREYEALRLARVEQLKQIEFMKIDIESCKDRTLRQRELKERLEVLQQQLKSLDSMIEEARSKTDEALLKQAASAGEQK